MCQGTFNIALKCWYNIRFFLSWSNSLFEKATCRFCISLGIIKVVDCHDCENIKRAFIIMVKKILDILITVDLYKCMDFILSTCKVTIYYKTKSIDKITNIYSWYIYLFTYLFYLKNSPWDRWAYSTTLNPLLGKPTT